MKVVTLACSALVVATSLLADETTVGRLSATESFFDFTLAGLERPVHYFASHAVEAGDSSATVLVIVHGWGDGVRLPLETPSFVAAAARLCGATNVPYVLAPVFPTKKTMAKFGQVDDGRARWCDSLFAEGRVRCLPDDDWRGGGDAAGTSLNSFDVIDRIFALLGDRTRYPNLTRVVLTGFSAGGQFAGRYAAVGKGAVRDGVTVDYAPMSPSTWIRLDEEVLWHYGLKGRPRYSARCTKDQILANLASRRQWNACGRKDVLQKPQTSLDSNPEAQAQGENRYDRFERFRDYVKGFPEWNARSSFHVFPEIGHAYRKAYADPAFVSFVCLGKMRSAVKF